MLNNRKGMAMLIVIGLVLMLLTLGGAVWMISAGHFGTSYHQIKRARAYYAAEAAMQHALWRCRVPSPAGYGLESLTFPYTDPSPPTVTDPNYSFTPKIVILELGGIYEPSSEEFYDCRNAPSDYCVFSRVVY